MDRQRMLGPDRVMAPVIWLSVKVTFSRCSWLRAAICWVRESRGRIIYPVALSSTLFETGFF